jgi:hypothetical protein
LSIAHVWPGMLPFGEARGAPPQAIYEPSDHIGH